MMVGDVSAKVRRPATETWCLIVSASRGIRAPAFPGLPPKSMGKTVARRCFEDTSMVARSWYEADVSERKREERAGCLVQFGDGLRFPGLDSLADEAYARGLFCTLRRRTERYCLPQ